MFTLTPPQVKSSRTNWMTNKVFIAVILTAASMWTGSPTLAGGVSQQDVLELRRSGAILPFEEILGFVYQRYPGAAIVEVELEEEDGQLIYEIEIYTAEGQLRELELNARDGRILEDELED